MIKLWKNKSWINFFFMPISWIWLLVTKFKLWQQQYNKTKIFVICVGNMVVGGSGKTPFVMYLVPKLQELGYKVAVLSRGYKGTLKKPTIVNKAKHTAKDVGDEPFMIADYVTTVVSANRKKGLELLIKNKYQIVVMDDGMQNSTVRADLNIVMFNGLNPFGNNLVIPAGPLRETLKMCMLRADMAVIIQENTQLKQQIISYGVSTINAEITPKVNHPIRASNKRYLAFAGIANPDKFFNLLTKYGYIVSIHKAYPDHYFYSNNEIKKLIELADASDLQIITTSKDIVKINKAYYEKIKVFAISLKINMEDQSKLINEISTKYLIKTKSM